MKKLTIIAALSVFAALGANAQTLSDVSEKYTAAIEKYTAKDYATAIPLFEEVITLGGAVGDEAATMVADARKALPGMYFSYGGSFYTAKKMDEAVALFEKAAAAAAETGNTAVGDRAKNYVGQTYLAMGAAPYNEGNFAAAAEIFARANAALPDNAKIATLLADSYGKVGEYDKSLEVFRGITVTEGDDATFKRERLKVYASELQGGDLTKALDFLSEAVQVDGDPQAYMMILQTADSAKNFDKVIELGERAAEAQTDAVQKSNAYSLLGKAYEQKGDKARAVESYRKVTAGPNAAAAKTNIGILQAQ